MDIDPTKNELTYVFSLQKYYQDLTDYVDLTLIINESEITTISGFQLGSVSVKETVLIWAENDFKPPITNIYSPFYTEAILKSVTIPTSDSKACLHGKGFYDAESSLKEIWIGVGSHGRSESIVYPMQLYRTLCYKGSGNCSVSKEETCDKTSDDTFQLIHLSVSGLQLDIIDNMTVLCINQTSDLQSCNISSYFLSVKVVNFAGLSRIVHSNPVQIDQTPPTFQYVKCLDPSNSEDEPTDRLGSSSTIGAYWKCSEDISQIEYYAVSIKQVFPEQNIMNRTDIGLKRRARFSLANTTFKDRNEYRVTVEAVNTAGLKAYDSCIVFVDLFPPEVDNVKSGLLFSDSDDPGSMSDDVPSVTSSQTKIGLTWNGGNNDTRFYQWQVGSSENKDDLFPRYSLSNSPKGSVAIVSGRLEIDGKEGDLKVAEFFDTENMTYEEIEDKRNASDIEKSFFMLEPGRCVYQSLYAVGWSHLTQKIKSRSACVRRSDDLYIQNVSDAISIASKLKGSNKWISDNSDARMSDIAAKYKLINGRIVFGTITQKDKTTSYGSAASAEYSPYITDPNLTATQTSRLLRNRIERFCGLSFFMSPAPVAHIEHLHLNVSLDKKCYVDVDHQPGLIYWNYETMEWKHVDEDCQDFIFPNVKGDIYSAELCPQRRDVKARDKRASPTLYSHPRHLELVRISSQVENKNPEIVTSSIYINEDNFVPSAITVFDPENDTVLYEIAKQPSHSICNISDLGNLDCSLEADFYGKDAITIRVTEINVPETVDAHIVEKVIELNILPEEDATERVFIDSKGKVFREKRPSMFHTLIVEANRSDTIFAGTIVLGDVDGNETFTEKLLFRPTGNSTFYLNESVDETGLSNRKLLPTRFRSVKTFGLTFKFSPALSGNMSFQFIAISANGLFTPSLTINLYILANPCVNGNCNHINGHNVCDSLDRASSFDSFFCSCNPGFSGTWCQVDINECGPEPCALMYDCEDLLNNYRCNINIPKLMAILTCSLFAVIGFLLIMRKIYKKYRRNKVSESRTNIQAECIATTDDSNLRPLSSRSIRLVTKIVENDNQDHAGNWFNDDQDVDNQKEVDISALSSFSNRVGSVLPPHLQTTYKVKLNAGRSYKKAPKVSKPRQEKSSVVFGRSSITDIEC